MADNAPVPETLTPSSEFMDAIKANALPSFDEHDNKMLTENGDLTFRSTQSPLVDLFYELTDAVSGDELKVCLNKAWAASPEVTLKIIWNARSIHLGKGNRNTFYRALGWLKENHPQTLLSNLPWLVRPLIQKKVPKTADEATSDGKENGDKSVENDNAVMVEAVGDNDEFELVAQSAEQQTKQKEAGALAAFDIKYGVSHGYWKDLLNILSLAAADELKVDGNPRKVSNIDQRSTKGNIANWKRKWVADHHDHGDLAVRYEGIDLNSKDPKERDWTPGRKKQKVKTNHEKIMAMLDKDEFYKTLHSTVAGLFVEQLKLDTTRLHSGKKAEQKHITLAAKWAPSAGGSHDNRTSIVNTIAEMLHPFETCCADTVDPADRKIYLKHAKIAYQSKTLSPLRKFLSVVERDITAENFDGIAYEHVPSVAMQMYTPLFILKDEVHFEAYLNRVASGGSQISGAVLIPSTLVQSVYQSGACSTADSKSAKGMAKAKQRALADKAADAQWNTLVQRMRDSGRLESSIAVCDVSGSMCNPTFRDKTQPIHSAIGMSLLIAEITSPPFGGAFITFSATPEVVRVGGSEDKRSLAEKVKYIMTAPWGMNTDFVAVFEDLLLPLAQQHKLTRDQMVKQVFVFSDMQFDSADLGTHNGYDRNQTASSSWSSSYDRIKKLYEDAGYDLPRLIFWNLAGRVHTSPSPRNISSTTEDPAPKPVLAHEENTALVSGYSQGQMKMFLDRGSFEDFEEDVVEQEDEDGNLVVSKEKKKQDPLQIVMRAVSHEAYRMLSVVD